MKFNIIVSTQITENYGAHAWDGKGQCPQYWKAKGGEEYRHPISLDLSEFQDGLKIQSFLKRLSSAVTRDDQFYREHVIDWNFLPVGQLTDGENRQVEFYGYVKYPVESPRKLTECYSI